MEYNFQTSSYDSQTIFYVDLTNKTTAVIHKNCTNLTLPAQNPRNICIEDIIPCHIKLMHTSVRRVPDFTAK